LEIPPRRRELYYHLNFNTGLIYFRSPGLPVRRLFWFLFFLASCTLIAAAAAPDDDDLLNLPVVDHVTITQPDLAVIELE